MSTEAIKGNILTALLGSSIDIKIPPFSLKGWHVVVILALALIKIYTGSFGLAVAVGAFQGGWDWTVNALTNLWGAMPWNS